MQCGKQLSMPRENLKIWEFCDPQPLAVEDILYFCHFLNKNQLNEIEFLESIILI